MKFMILMIPAVYQQDVPEGFVPPADAIERMGKFNQSMADAGILGDLNGLHPPSKGARVSFKTGKPVVTDGPFAETKELIAGFWLWNVKSMEEAIEWLKRCPNPHDEAGEVEIRPVVIHDDFGCIMPPELREQEASIRARTLGLGAVRFETASELFIAGLSNTYDAESRRNIPAQWARFASHIGKVPGQVGRTSYGVCYNVQPNCLFDYLTGVEVAGSTKLPPEFTSVQIKAGRYAVVTHEGHISSIGQTIDKIWSQWVPESSIKTASAPCFECYTDKFDPKTGNGSVEIWVPLEG